MDREIPLVNGINGIDRRGHRTHCASDRPTAIGLRELSGRRKSQAVSSKRRTRDDQSRITTAQDLFALRLDQ